MTPRATVLLFALLGSATADTLTLRSGATVTGTWLGVGSGQIKFQVGDQIQAYPRSDVSTVAFGDSIQPPLPPIAAPPPPSDAAPEPPGNIQEPEKIGAFYFRNPKGELAPLEVAQGTVRSRGSVLRRSFYYQTNGAKSPFRVKSGQSMLFVVSVANGIDPAIFSLYTLNVSKDARTLEVRNFNSDAFKIPLDITKVGGSYGLKPTKELSTGEYCFSPSNSNDAFCFGVDPASASAAPAEETRLALQDTDKDEPPVLTRKPGPPAEGPGTVDKQLAPLNDTTDPTIADARSAASSFAADLPNFLAQQVTTRYAAVGKRRTSISWRLLDTVTADVIAENGAEKYENILVNGKPPRQDVEKTGSWSRGEFSSLLQDVLSPLTNADFHGKRPSTIVNRAAFRYDFAVAQPNSHWHIESDGQSYMPAYTGTIWIDKENHRVLRIELEAQGMPGSFPLDTVESAVGYDYVFIGEGKYLLPNHSEALSCQRGTNQCSRNVIDFRNYRKLTARTEQPPTSTAPPPAQPGAPPPTIELGQTRDQIVSIMGQPEKIANLGARQIYFYKDLKVTLTDGKVTDIQ